MEHSLSSTSGGMFQGDLTMIRKPPGSVAAQLASVMRGRLQGPADSIIMMIDDEPLNIEITQAFLEEAGYSYFISTSDSPSAVDMMRRRRPHVLLLDLMMPRVSGLQILAVMKEDPVLRHIPVIVLTSSSDAEIKLKALALGAMDFLSKPVDASELALRLRNTLAARAYHDHIANHDALTGLPNRQRYKECLDEALIASQVNRDSGSILHIGVDRLSHINEALGRGVGDTLLQRIAKRLRQCVDTELGGEMGDGAGGSPTLYRFDGDEFAVLVPHGDEAESTAGFISKLLETVASSFKIGEHEVFATCSMGVAMFPQDGKDFDTLVSNANIAMRHAKQSGRNTYGFYSSELNERAAIQLNRGGELRRALDRDELEIYYQPKVDVRTGALMGIESMVRWVNPRGEAVESDQILPLAESSGLTMPLGEWMFDRLVTQIAEWRKAGLQLVPVGINVSLEQFRKAQLMQVVRGALSNSGGAEHLCLELNEASMMETPAENVAALRQFKDLGLRLAMDNFGAGFSSLSYLRRFPLDEIKIDKSFLVKVESGSDNAAIVVAMIAMARSLKLTVVATGLNTPHQLAFLKNNNCDQCQGRLFNDPAPVREFTAKWMKPVAR
ncbi:MAG: EAL domain-containing protein [Bdellovibrionales bacterium]|nr:EAL domain-containing protein [Ramlibacter sp.]